jgi:hypothetical protein
VVRWKGTRQFGLTEITAAGTPEDRNAVELGYDVIQWTEKKLRNYEQVSL